MRVAPAQVAPVPGKIEAGLRMLTARFRTLFVLHVTRVGVGDGLPSGGGSIVVDPLGELGRRAPSLKQRIDVVSLLRGTRIRFPLLRDEKPEVVWAGPARIPHGDGPAGSSGRVSAAAAFPGPPPDGGRQG